MTDFAPPTAPPGAPADAPASVGRRIGGGLIDLAVQVVLFGAFAAAFGETESSDGSFSVNVTGLPALGMVVLWFGYFFLTEWRLQASLGKLAVGLRVVGEDGSRPGAGTIAVRTLLRVVDGLFLYVVGLVAVAVSPRNQRLGDMAARTLVVSR